MTPVLPDPDSSPDGEPPKGGRLPGWVLPVVIVSIVLGLAGIGTGIYAIHKVPPKTSGPTGQTGATGPAGAAGATGAAGPAGPAGPAGTIAATTIVSTTTLVSAPAAPVGTVLTAKTACPAGDILVSGGAQVSDPGPNQNVALRSSFPVSPTTWEVISVVVATLPAGVSMSMKPFVVCGVVPRTTTTTTTTTTHP